MPETNSTRDDSGLRHPDTPLAGTSAPARPSATLILVRDGARGLEVFMIRRALNAKLLGGFYAFPGGALEKEDAHGQWAGPAGADFADAASRLLDVGQDGIAFWVAAIRECFEEVGLLLAEDTTGSLVRMDTPERVAEVATWRNQLNDGTLPFRDCLARLGLRPAFDRLFYLSHWIAPVGLPRQTRFDTRFFVAIAPTGQEASHDRGETMDHLWLHPKEALAREKPGKFEMILPTRKTLELLARFDACESLLAYLRQPRHVPPVMPRRARGRDGLRPLLPHDHAYAEVGKLDPEGRLTASYELIAGVPVRLSPRLRRVTAPNPGFMTTLGTNSYLLGDGDDIAVIDPGPDLVQHLELLMAQANGADGRGRIRWILATHTHPDHSPGAARLKALTGAEIIGLPPPVAEHQDQSFRPDRVPRPDERLAIAGCTLRVIHTPGHASNHLCYLLEEEKILFTGDHLIQGSTVVISPPDGDMGAYVDSLKALRREDIAYLAPGHGFLMDRHRELIDALLVHRQQREDKVLDAMGRLGPCDILGLLPLAYDEVPPRIHPLAARSLLAHLLKLKREGRVQNEGDLWRVQ